MIRTPPPSSKPLDANGNWTPEWRAYFDRQVTPTVNTLETNQISSLTSINPTIAQTLLNNS
jgi:hypothetical protein